jgi:signal transduction histidine kinase
VQQILVNLFSNAIKYTSEGSVTLRVKASPTVAALIFEVADTGIGIPKEDLSTIFDRYKKASNSNQAKHKGTGLGLAICKELVERQHGEIWVDSVVGEGTSFYFSLPLADTEYNNEP